MIWNQDSLTVPCSMSGSAVSLRFLSLKEFKPIIIFKGLNMVRRFQNWVLKIEIKNHVRLIQMSFNFWKQSDIEDVTYGSSHTVCSEFEWIDLKILYSIQKLSNSKGFRRKQLDLLNPPRVRGLKLSIIEFSRVVLQGRCHHHFRASLTSWN